MSNLPPPPTVADPGSFAWVQWNASLYNLLTTQASVAWSLLNFAGSSLADLQTRTHAMLQSIEGSGTYHLSQTLHDRIAGFISQATNPTTTDIPVGQWALYKNTATNTLKLWANDGGTLKSVTLT